MSKPEQSPSLKTMTARTAVMFAAVPAFLGVIYLLRPLFSESRPAEQGLMILATSIVATALFALAMLLVLFAIYLQPSWKEDEL